MSDEEPYIVLKKEVRIFIFGAKLVLSTHAIKPPAVQQPYVYMMLFFTHLIIITIYVYIHQLSAGNKYSYFLFQYNIGFFTAHHLVYRVSPGSVGPRFKLGTALLHGPTGYLWATPNRCIPKNIQCSSDLINYI